MEIQDLGGSMPIFTSILPIIPKRNNEFAQNTSKKICRRPVVTCVFCLKLIFLYQKPNQESTKMLTAWLEEWTREENDKFESALFTVEEATTNHWEVIASMVGGNKTADHIHKHYLLLVKDVELIELGALNHIYAPLFSHWSSTVGHGISGQDQVMNRGDSSEYSDQEQDHN